MELFSRDFWLFYELFSENEEFSFGFYPVNFLIPLEPGHLALGVADAVFQYPFFHFRFRYLSLEEKRAPFVFEPEGFEALPGNTSANWRSMQPFYFREHSLLHALFEARGNQFFELRGIFLHADKKDFGQEGISLDFRNLSQGARDLERAHYAVAVFPVYRIRAFGIHSRQFREKRFCGFSPHLL